MKLQVHRNAVVAVLVTALLALPFLLLFLYLPSIPQEITPVSAPAPAPAPDPAAAEAGIVISQQSQAASRSDDASLEAMLASAATSDKTVIITTLNQAWATKGAILDIFLESFNKGVNTQFLLNHLVVMALDNKSFERCRELHRHCFRLETEGVDFSSRKPYMTQDFLKMMWRRMVLLRTILEMGYNFVFTDADIVWFRNPFEHFAKDAEFQISSDKFTGNPRSFSNWPNCGYQYVQSNNRTIAMYTHWCKGGETRPSVDEQTLFRLMLRRAEFSQYQVKIRFLDTLKFSGLCEISKNMTQVVTMHANCCTGMENKVQDLRQAWKDWEFSRTDPRNASGAVVWHVPSACKNSIWPSPPPGRSKRHPSPNLWLQEKNG